MSEEEKKKCEEKCILNKENKILKVELEKKDMTINNAINAIENLRQDFADNLQSDFILIIEILKNSKVIDW